MRGSQAQVPASSPAETTQVYQTPPAPSNRAQVERRDEPWLVLLDLDGGPSVCKLLLDGLGLVLGHALFDGLWRAVHQILGFFQPQAGNLAHGLDDIDLVRTD